MAITISHQVHIEKSPSAVFNFVINPQNHLRFASAFNQVELVSGEPGSLGARVARSATFMGKDICTLHEVVAIKPNELIAMKLVEGPMPMDEVFLLEEADGGTRVTLVLSAEPKGMLKLAAPMVKLKVDQQVTTDLENLKRILEEDEL
jgi:uncharacterized membrane protein